MSASIPSVNSLVLYKNRPAKVIHIGNKVEIEFDSGDQLKVRPKDIDLLHPGPVSSLTQLKAGNGETETAWELLAGSTTTLPELAELIYETFTPSTAWATWKLVSDGLYFQGDLDTIVACTAEQVSQTKADRAAKAARVRAWNDFLARAQKNQINPEDEQFLREVEEVAYDRQSKSSVLRELGRSETAESAHAWLLQTGYWNETVNPYPQRMGLNTTSSSAEIPNLPAEERLDLTHLPAFAIDDADTLDPDDALSLEGNWLWVHVADVAALIRPNSRADLEARARGANLYLPEQTVTMLPPTTTDLLGLGLAEISPALSFGLELNSDGETVNFEIVPSWVKVQRLSYESVEVRLDQSPFDQFHQIARKRYERRRANGEISIDLPEVKVRVEDGQVKIQPILPLRSREIVREAMLAVGEAVARFAITENIAFPFTTQDAPNAQDFSETLSGMFAQRFTLKRSQLTSVPGPHAGLGLDVYTKATSPLRRYSDLIAHQQLRAHLHGQSVLNAQQVLERVGAAEAIEGSVRQAERLSRRHWTLVYLMQHPNWRGEGIVVDKRGRRSIVLIPELDLEAQLYLRDDAPLDSMIPLLLDQVELAELEVHFQVE